MVNVSDWSTTPAANTSVDGINIAEGCPAANMNGMGRAIMAGVKSMYSALPNLANYLLKDGSVATTGQLKRDAAGAYIYNASAANASGKRTIQATGGSLPSGAADGDELLEYA